MYPPDVFKQHLDKYVPKLFIEIITDQIKA